jgi:hypothetical protein
MDQLVRETSKKVYVRPQLEKRERLTEVAEGMVVITTTARRIQG